MGLWTNNRRPLLNVSQLSGRASLLTQVVGNNTSPGRFIPLMFLTLLSCAKGPPSGPGEKKPDPYLQQMFWVSERSVFFPRVSRGDSVVGCYLRKMSSLAPRSPESPPGRMHSAERQKQSCDEFHLLRS